MELPSRELMIEVDSRYTKEPFTIHESFLMCENYGINIYELMHLMKEWAWTNGYYYWYENSQIHIKELYYSPKVHIDFESKRPFNIDIDTKACQWIFEQKESK